MTITNSEPSLMFRKGDTITTILHGDEARIVAEHIRALARPNWQPIDTAPTDGSYCDLWVRSVGVDGPSEFRMTCCWFANGAWYSKNANPLEGYSIKSTPTHWMQPPAPPEGNSQ